MRRRPTSRRPTSTRSSSRRSRRTTRTSTSGWPAGTSLWYQDKGFGITSGSQWQKVYSLPTAGKTFTAVAYSGNRAFATWCGPCSNSGAPFARGAVVGTFAGGTWTFKAVAFPADFPNRYLQGAAIDPKDENHLIVGVNGFSRRFTEGPGAGIGHIFESKDGGLTWTDTSGNFPDIPVNDVVSLQSGGLFAATDLGVLYRAPASATWQRLGSQSAGHGRDGPDARPRRQRLRGDSRSRHLAHLGRRPLGRSDITARARGPPSGGPRRFCG